jgi:hypothetical protein
MHRSGMSPFAVSREHALKEMSGLDLEWPIPYLEAVITCMLDEGLA